MTNANDVASSQLDGELVRLAQSAVAETSELLLDLAGSAGTGAMSAMSAGDEVIKARLRAARPDDSFLGEEGGLVEGSSQVTWVLDPIDSTANFARGIPTWSISLAAVAGDEVRAAVVACPSLGEVFSATRATGVLLNDEPLRPPPVRPLEAAMIGIGWGPREVGARQAVVAGRLIPLVGKVRSPGSPALGLAWAAAGRFDAAYYEMDFSDWDVAAGSFLCECAGLRVTQQLPALDGGSPRLLAAAPHLYEALSDAVLDSPLPNHPGALIDASTLLSNRLPSLTIRLMSAISAGLEAGSHGAEPLEIRLGPIDEHSDWDGAWTIDSTLAIAGEGTWTERLTKAPLGVASSTPYDGGRSGSVTEGCPHLLPHPDANDERRSIDNVRWAIALVGGLIQHLEVIAPEAITERDRDYLAHLVSTLAST